MNPGVYPNLPMSEYLAIPALSGGVLTTLVQDCPLAAWTDSYLNPNREQSHNMDADIGSVAHKLLLEKSAEGIEVIDPADHPNEKGGGYAQGWTNKSIKAAREQARLAGKIPMLIDAMTDAAEMAATANTFIAGADIAVCRAFSQNLGESETTIVWREGDLLCRIRPDRLSADRRLCVSYKTTPGSANPHRWSRSQLLDYYVGEAFYQRGIAEVFDEVSSHVFLVQETKKPYLCSLIGLSPAWMELGARKVRHGMHEWRNCLASGVWPGYGGGVAYPDVPVWEEAAWTEREILGVEERLEFGSQP